MAGDIRRIIRLSGRIFFATVLAGLSLFFLNEWPRLNPASPEMAVLESDHFVIYYEESDRRPAIELKTMLEDRGVQAALLLDTASDENSKSAVFIYGTRSEFAQKRWGLLGALLRQGDPVMAAKSRDVMMVVSPRAMDDVADERSVLQAAVKGYVRGLIEHRGLPVWVTEGIASLFSDGTRNDESDPDPPVPDVLFNIDPVVFESGGGIRYADAFVAWLVSEHGTGVLKDLAAYGERVFETLETDSDTAWLAWTAWLREGRPGDPRIAGL